MPTNVRRASSGTRSKPGAGNKPGGGGGRGNLLSSGTQGYQPGGSFFDFQAAPVAGVNPLLQQAAAGASGLGAIGGANAAAAGNLFTNVGAGNQYLGQATERATNLADNRSPEFTQALAALRSMGDVSRRQVTGANIEKDPAFNAARQAYSNTVSRRAQNAAALAGLGRSTALTNAQAAGESAYMTPIIQGSMAREERGIGREMSALGQQAQGLFGASGQRGADARTAIQSLMQAGGQRTQEQLAAAGGLGNLAGAERSLAQNAIQAQQAVGTQGRGIEQQQLDAPYQEQQRLYREALNTMYGPLGMIGSLVGAQSTQSKK